MLQHPETGIGEQLTVKTNSTHCPVGLRYSRDSRQVEVEGIHSTHGQAVRVFNLSKWGDRQSLEQDQYLTVFTY